MAKAVARAAVAVFVKTPEYSPVKTRLASDIGAPAALAAYEESLAILTQTLRQATAAMPALRAYWAVGERRALKHRRWQALPALWTGGGGLGERLARVYATLRRRHGRAILIGGDCPQVTADDIIAAARASGIVVGPAHDGGFYLFAAAGEIGADIWQGVEYSRSDTRENLLRHFAGDAVRRLPPRADMDTGASLRRVIAELRRRDAAAAARLAAAAGVQ